MSESEFEQELRQARPVPVSEGLRRAIEASLEKPSGLEHRSTAALPRLGSKMGDRWRFLFFRTSFALGTAALVACALVGFRTGTRDLDPVPTDLDPGNATVGRASELTPVDSWRELIDAGDEHFFYGAGQEPALRVRLRSVEHHTWSDAQSGALIAVEVPREDILLIPVSMQ